MSQSEAVMIDSNVPMYAAGNPHPYREPCQRVLARILTGEIAAVSSAEIHREILYRYLSMGRARKAREVSEDFQGIVPNVLPVSVREIVLARDLSPRFPAWPARDLIHLVTMLNHGITTIVSADTHFDRAPEIRRLDPMVLARQA